VTLISTNPSKNYELVGEVEASTPGDVEETVGRARSAAKAWNAIGLERRLEFVRALRDVFAGKQGALAELMAREMGMPIVQCRQDMRDGIDFLDWYCDNAVESLAAEVTYESATEIHEAVREPYGVAAVITPWNFPFTNFVWQVGQNLICGNVVVFKDSEEVPLFGKEIEKAFAEADFPTGVFGEVYGDGKTGEMLVSQEVDLLCFTGSGKVGREIYRKGADRLIPVHLELGGSSPGIVFEDADLDKVIDTIYAFKFLNCGQMCKGLKRLLVHESKLDETVTKLVALINGKIMGAAEDPGTDIGPMVAERQVVTLEEQVREAVDKGAVLRVGGQRPAALKGAYYEPTLVTGITTDMRIWVEEVFGPVLPMITFRTRSEAIALANDTSYGLGAYVFTEDRSLYQEMARALESGMVSQNNLNFVRPCNPFGGYKQSGIGREHGKQGFYELTQVKVVATEK
jgi:succinate-semialdehyde dehydrogenase/glutarate-semialdehyde dehydrogenase